MNEKKELRPIRKLHKNLWKWVLTALAVMTALTVFYLSDTSVEVPKKLPDVVAPVNPLLLVNSTEPSALNIELAAHAEKQDENKFNDADIAAIAYGKLLQSIKKDPEYQTHYAPLDVEKIYPAKPLLVKSYQWFDHPDYYLVPFIQDGQFVAWAAVTVLKEEPGSVRYESGGGLGLAADRFLPVDIDQARSLIQTEKGLAQAPIPRLVFHQDLLPGSQEDKAGPTAYHQPAWEFALPGDSLWYVNQAGEVLTKDLLPWYEKLTLLPYHPENTQIEFNTLRRDDGWQIKVEKIELMGAYPYDPDLQSVQIYCLVENSTDLDQLFMPRGTVVSLTAVDGKTYPIQPALLDPLYISIQQWHMDQDGRKNVPGRPDIALPEVKLGELKICLNVVDVDANTEQFTFLTYRDENGRDFIIPLDLTPVLV